MKLVEDEKELDVQGIVALGVIAAIILFTIIFVIVICCVNQCRKHKSEKVQSL